MKVQNRIDLLGLYINAFIYIAAQKNNSLYKEDLENLIELIDEKLTKLYKISILSKFKDIHEGLLLFIDFYYNTDDKIEFYFLSQNSKAFEQVFENDNFMELCNEIYDLYYEYKEIIEENE